MKASVTKNPVTAAFAVLVLFLGLAVALVFAYVDRERQRDLLNWQVRLGVLADIQFQAVDDWIGGRFSVLQELADNASLRFYLMQVALEPKAGRTEEPAQLSYLRNLLVATAERSGFAGKAAPGGAIPANLPAAADQGIALLAPDGSVITTTAGFAIDDEVTVVARQAIASGRRQFIDLYANRRGEVVMGFVVPVPPLHAPAGEAKAIGALVGLERAQDALFQLLSRRMAGMEEEVVLVRREGDNVVYLTSLADGTPPLKKRLRLDTPGLDTALALAAPGTFAAGVHDHRGRDVLMTSRAFKQPPWVLVSTVSARQALQESRDHQRFLLTALLLATLTVAIALVAAWRHGSSVRAARLSGQLREQSRKIASQARLLQSIIDHTADLVVLVDDEGRFVFVNPALARAVGLEVEDFAGKSLSSVLGPEPAKALSDLMDKARELQEPVSAVQPLEIGRSVRLYHLTTVPFLAEEEERRVLVVAHDVTAIQAEQVQRAQGLRQIIRTLMRAVDLHDPHCAHHSERTAEVAVAIGRAMELDEAELERLEMAAQLANVGKLFVPREILQKPEPLSEQDQAVLRQHVQHALDILSGLELGEGVLETIAQKHEYLDGSGYPKGLRGEQMLLSGKILAVANAFVAMVSTRAYRNGMSMDQALDQLLRESPTKFDRHVVAALFHVAENRSDWQDWVAPAGQ